MKNNTNIKGINSYFSIIGLVVLLLLSPCHVRNTIQSEVGIPQTDVLNKAKTTLSTSNCSVSEDNDFSTSAGSTLNKSDQYPGSFNTVSIITSTESTQTLSFFNERENFVRLLPLYILYQNLKVYL